MTYLSHSLGDILTSAMRNTQNLLRMPYGCGEQNMVLFAPNIYVLDYLSKTQQLTPEVKSKAIGYLNTGEWLNERVKSSHYYFNNKFNFPKDTHQYYATLAYHTMIITVIRKLWQFIL